jgi:hypothetical protein
VTEDAAAEGRWNVSRLIVAVIVMAAGLVLLVPNGWQVWRHYGADAGQAVTARWSGSTVTTSTRDTVAVPTFVFERRIGPVVQECRVDLLRYRHAPAGRPRFEAPRVVAGSTCDDIVILDDPPRERIWLALFGLLVTIGGLVLAGLARLKP